MYATALYTGNGATTQFAVPFPFISRDHVSVTVDGAATAFTWLNDGLIQISPAPASGKAVRIARSTSRTVPLVDFQDAQVLTETDLDLATKQNLYVAQEAFDNAESGTVSAELAAAVAAAQAAAADAASDAADTSLWRAQTSIYRTVAVDASVNAEGFADAASASATAAAGSATAAAGSASAAATSASDAAATVSSKVSKAGDTMTGNLDFNGTALRIKVSGTAGPIGDRTLLQCRDTNGHTIFGVVPNGTSTLGAIQCYNNSDLSAPLGYVDIRSGPTVHTITSAGGNGGTALPVRFNVAAKYTYFTTDGLMGIGTDTPLGNVGSSAYLNTSWFASQIYSASLNAAWVINGYDYGRLHLRSSNGAAGVRNAVIDNNLGDIVFRHLDETLAGTTRMTIAAGGTVTVEGYTKLGGSGAPAIKTKKLTGTTNSAQGATTSIAHGLTASKIISVTAMVEYTSGFYVSTGYNISSGYCFHLQWDTTNINVQNAPSGNTFNSASILSKPVTILVTYEA